LRLRLAINIVLRQRGNTNRNRGGSAFKDETTTKVFGLHAQEALSTNHACGLTDAQK
jgi:hypothetical protein